MDYPVCNHLLDTLSKRTRGARNQSVSKHGNITGIVIAIYFNHIHEITIKIRVTYNLQEPPKQTQTSLTHLNRNVRLPGSWSGIEN